MAPRVGSYNPAVFRRRRLPPELVSAAGRFDEVLRAVESAKQVAVDSLPRARAPGTPLGEALLEFEQWLLEADRGMPGWRRPELDTEWDRCRSGLEQALAEGLRLRLEAPEMGFDRLAFTIQDLIAPLEPFEVAAERFRSLRR
jgi:hypothetical protein